MIPKIKKLIQDALKELGLESFQNTFDVSHPKNIDFGDYSTNIGIIMGTSNKVFDIIKYLQGHKPAEVDRIEERMGFINFYLSPEFFANSIEEINKAGEEYGKTTLLKGQKIMVEYTDPNPFKEFHIGHLMDNAIGESVARIIEASGAQVKKANWQGDVGMHVASAVWGILDSGLSVDSMNPNDLGKAYAHGATRAKEDENVKKEIGEINKHIFTRDDANINHVYDTGRQISLDYFETIYKRLGTKFDYYFFESKEGIEGKLMVEAHLDDGIFEKSEGAIIFRGEKYALHTRVFINSNGLPTYEAKELGLNKKKFEIEPDLSKSIIFSANEISEYFKVLLKVMSLILPEVAEKTVHMPHGMLKLPTGKMSSRTGDVITAERLIGEVKEKVLEKLKDREYSKDEKESISEVVAVGAIKYSILRQSIGGDIIFDFDKSLSFEGDSGPYLQYSYVRAKSVLEKAKISQGETLKNFPKVSPWETTKVEKLLYRFPEVIERAGREYAPHYIVTYLTELASAFNSFYGNAKIIDESDPSRSDYKLSLTSAVSHVLKNGLNLLGIKVPEKM